MTGHCPHCHTPGGDRVTHTCVRDPMAELRDLVATVRESRGRDRELEQAADPRTAEGPALDRWARILGFTDREPDETDVELRARLEYEEPDEIVCGFDPGFESDDGVVTFTSAADRVDASMLSYGRRGGKMRAFGTAVHEAMERAIERSTHAAYECLASVAALAIGTRVRVDDKANAYHEDVGTIVRVPGPGDAPDVYDVDVPGGTLTLHRAALALVDDTLPECPGCGGEGAIPLFTGVSDCPACGGSGVVS